jgi:serine/threonine-protein kinase
MLGGVSEKTRLLDTALLPTLSNEDLARTLEMTQVRFAQLEETVAASPGSTIEPANASLDSIARRAVEGLGSSQANHIAEGLAIGRTIGEGGMGLVRHATQRSLGRPVAVKTLKNEAKNERATLRLLREAWITGSLEHPNIVPVYDLGLDKDGAPIIVLKLIEGKPWSDVARLEKPNTDPLEENLRIFMQVCNAVSLAHARGVIHRDLKLENVMIGRFGEVYLVDWGIAVSLRPDPTGRLPLASDATEMAGTPAYMAPEMLGNTGSPLTERTDVYLLGAILHELLVGKPPHAGDNLRAILASIVVSKVDLPPSVPRELAAMVLRACSREPAERFASAEALKERVEWYLRHRGSLALSAAAALRVREMERIVAEDGEDARERLHHLFAEVRFGYRQAIASSSDNEGAKEGIRSTTRLVVEYELAHGTADAAAGALAELDEAPADLVLRVATAQKAQKARLAKLENLDAEFDPTTGQRTRLAVGLMACTIWTVNPELAGLYFRHYPDASYDSFYIATGIVTALVFIVGRWGRESLIKTMINRRLLAIVMTMLALQFTLTVGAKLMNATWRHVLPLVIFNWCGAMANFAILLDRSFWPSMIVFFGCFFWSCIIPEHVFHAMTAAAGSLFLNIAFAWMRPREDSVFFVQRVKERREALRELKRRL